MKGERNGKWKGGMCLNDKGHLRITAGPHRNTYAHRRVMEMALEHPISYIFLGDGVIPKRMTVEHSDHCRTHNCLGNLLLLEKGIHDWCSLQQVKYNREHIVEYLAMLERNSVPDWVTNEQASGIPLEAMPVSATLPSLPVVSRG